jgi:hypothetical protein
MASKTIKRRTFSAETGRSSEKRMEATIPDSATEPLLENTPREDKTKVGPTSIHSLLVCAYCVLIMPFYCLFEDI